MTPLPLRTHFIISIFIALFNTGHSLYFPQTNIQVDFSPQSTFILRPVAEPRQQLKTVSYTIPHPTAPQCPTLQLLKGQREGVLMVGEDTESHIDTKCTYEVKGVTEGEVGEEEATLNLTLSFPKQTCSNVMRCWRGPLTHLRVQVKENSEEVIATGLGYPLPHHCPSKHINYQLTITSTDENVIYIGDGMEGECFHSLRIKGGLDREYREEYSFTMSCEVEEGESVEEKLFLNGTLVVLDEDDNGPMTQDGAMRENVSISLNNAHNKYEPHQRLIHDDSKEKSLLFRDWDTLSTNSFRLRVEGDWKGLLNVTYVAIEVRLGENKPSYTIVRPTISLSSNIHDVEPWPGLYCVEASFTDISVIPLLTNESSMTYRICVHWSKNGSHLQELNSAWWRGGGINVSVVEDSPNVPLSSIMSSDPPLCNDLCVVLLSAIGTSLSLFILVVLYVLRSRVSEKKRGRGGVSVVGRGDVTGDLSGMSMMMLGSDGDYMRDHLHTQTIHTDLVEIDSKWEIPRTKLILDNPIGTGQFGQVYKARTDAIRGREGTFVDVAVKMLKETHGGDNGKSSRDEFLSEFCLLQQLDHPNVIKVLGVCTTIGGPLYLVMDYAEFGSLRGFLRKCRRVESVDNGGVALETEFSGNTLPSTPSVAEQKDFVVTPTEILQFSWQIAKGMTYLSDMKMVHRDLAARNILLTRGKVCKISDFGLTRDIYVDEAYQKKSRGPVPVKWLAPESLADEVYTNHKKSDVWSYGVLLWELATLGASPYPGIPAEQLYTLLKGGYRMPPPPNTSPHFYGLMRECWAQEPWNRPTFRSLEISLGKLLEDGIEYLKLDLPLVSNPTYNYFQSTQHTPPTEDHPQPPHNSGDADAGLHMYVNEPTTNYATEYPTVDWTAYETPISVPCAQ